MIPKNQHAWLLLAALGSLHCSSDAIPSAAEAGALDAMPTNIVVDAGDDAPRDGSAPVDGSALVDGSSVDGSAPVDVSAPVLPHKIPSEHRAQAVACQPTAAAPKPPGGGMACASDADCAGDAATLFSYCLRGRCAFDQCLTDADCHGGVCGCSTDYYGGNIAYHPNICVPSNCHVDSDCGPDGYCSPNRGHCGTFEGFFCHHPADACYDASECPGPGPHACQYAPTVGAYVCSLAAVCNG
jgi:hypothetical protein